MFNLMRNIVNKKRDRVEIEEKEYTINQLMDSILKQIPKKKRPKFILGISLWCNEAIKYMAITENVERE